MRRFLLVVNKGPDAVSVPMEFERSWDYHEMLWHKDSKKSPLADRAVPQAYIKPEWRKFEAFKNTSPGNLRDYDAVCLADDDIQVPAFWGPLFEAFIRTGMRVGTPALTPSSYIAHPIMRQQPGVWWRETNYLDIMCVMFTKQGIRDHWDTFSAPREPWGIESIWAQRELAAGRAIAIIDGCPALHSRPVNASPERVAVAMADHDELLKRFGVERIKEHKTLKAYPL